MFDRLIIKKHNAIIAVTVSEALKERNIPALANGLGVSNRKKLKP
jgi:hypothetical protein